MGFFDKIKQGLSKTRALFSDSLEEVFSNADAIDPLAGIRLNAELLSRGRIPTEKLRHGALEAIILESDRLGRMVDELLDFRRLEKGTRKYKLETFDLAEFVLDPAELQAAVAASHGRAEIKSEGPGASVVADKEAIRQFGMILISNALIYPKGTF